MDPLFEDKKSITLSGPSPKTCTPINQPPEVACTPMGPLIEQKKPFSTKYQFLLFTSTFERLLNIFQVFVLQFLLFTSTFEQ